MQISDNWVDLFFILLDFATGDKLNCKNWTLTEYQQFTSAMEAKLCQLFLLTVHFQKLLIVCFAFLARTSWSLLQHCCMLFLAPALFFNIIVSHREGTVTVMAFLLAHWVLYLGIHWPQVFHRPLHVIRRGDTRGHGCLCSGAGSVTLRRMTVVSLETYYAAARQGGKKCIVSSSLRPHLRGPGLCKNTVSHCLEGVHSVYIDRSRRIQRQGCI